MIPTLFGIMVVNFVIIQAAPGGPVELMIARIKGTEVEATARLGGSASGETASGQPAREVGAASSGREKYRGARGIDPELIRDLERQFGFDQPLHVRFVRMLRQWLTFDFGNSFFRDQRVVDL